jgi:WD40 repeat protein
MTHVNNNSRVIAFEPNQEQFLNRIHTLIARGEVDSAKKVLSLKDNPLKEEMSHKILTIISDHSSQITQWMRNVSGSKAYSILLNGPPNLLEELQKNKIRTEIVISHVFSCRELLNHILDYLKPSNILDLRLVNRHFSKEILSLPLTWNMHFSQLPAGFQAIEKNSTLYFHCKKINENIKKRHFRQHTFDNRSFSYTYSTNFHFYDMHLNKNRLALVDDWDLTIKIWDLNKKELDQVIDCRKHWDSDFSVHPHVKMEDGYIYFAKGKTIEVWNLNKPNLPVSPYKKIRLQDNDKDTIQRLAGNKVVLDMVVGGYNLYSLSDRILKIWDRETGQIKHEIIIDNTHALTRPKRILVRDDLIYGLADMAIYIWDRRASKLVHRFNQSRKYFSTIEKDNRDLYVGTSDGKIYSVDLRNPSVQKKCQTLFPIRISQLCVDGNYLFSQSCISNEYEDDKQTVQIFEKQSGQSLYVLDKTTPLFNRIIGVRENIQKMQMHKGVLYVSSYYSNGDSFMEDLFGLDRFAIKTWDFNVD